MLVIFAGYSVTHFVNVARVLIASTHGVYHIARFDPLLVATSLANLLLLGYTVRYGVITLAFTGQAGISGNSGDGSLVSRAVSSPHNSEGQKIRL